MEAKTSSKVVAIWLNTGKKLDAKLGIVLTDKGFIVRLGELNTLIVPPSAVVAVECIFETKEEVDKVFDG